MLYWNQRPRGTISGVPAARVNTTEAAIERQEALPSPVVQESTSEKPEITRSTVPEITFSAVHVIPKKPPTLDGIMYSPSRPQAILNGRIISNGDTVGEFTVDEILPDMVKVSSGGDKFDLRMR